MILLHGLAPGIFDGLGGIFKVIYVLFWVFVFFGLTNLIIKLLRKPLNLKKSNGYYLRLVVISILGLFLLLFAGLLIWVEIYPN